MLGLQSTVNMILNFAELVELELWSLLRHQGGKK